MAIDISSAVALTVEIVVLLVRILFTVLEALWQVVVPPKEKSVANETVLITGSGHGIGKELALLFASLGAKVICVDINKENNDNTVKELKDRGYNKVHSYQCDVSNQEEVVKLASKVTKEVGDVTVLVNNAGIMPCHPLRSSSPEEIRKIFDINVFAHLWLLKEFLPSMIRNNHGHIVAMSSMAGVVGFSNLVPYCASKFAVRGLMEALLEELREDPCSINIKLTTICPVVVDTGLVKKPKIRFPSLMGIVTAQEAANQVVSAMRRDLHELTIPSCLITVNNLFRLFPVKAALLIKDFLDSGVESHD